MTYSELLGQIKKIQEKLWATTPYGNVSIIVGTGFSKNSIPIDGAKKKFPDWSELAMSFLDSLYPDDDDEQRKQKKIKSEVPAYISRLAQEYIELHSQKELNDLIEKSIPDMQYIPGKVHEELLKLPFKDIFTTNYDTLLERASYNNYEREYRVITTKEQLSGSISPRIIKLHGSFPNVTPYIISEEHFRRYPIEYKPFYNTVIQSLIENTLILIGFSGEDPNFLKWIGWIRDELPDIRQKVYICTIPRGDEFNEAQKRLFAKRGVELLDLNIAIKHEGLEGSPNKYQEAILWFFLKLKEGETKESARKWPYSSLSQAPGNALQPHKLTKSKINSSIVSYLETIRETFPGWRIVPAQNRLKLYSHILRDYGNKFEDILKVLSDTEECISLIDNYFWVKHILLESLSYHESEIFRKYINNILNGDAISLLSKSSQTKLTNILIYLYIDARENLELEVMDFYESEINKVDGKLQSQVDWFKREVSLYLLKTGNYKRLRKHLLEWDLSEQVLSIELLFKASFLMEAGMNEDSKRILFNIIELVRRNPSKNLELKSIEGLCIYLIQKFDDRWSKEKDTDSEDYEERMLRLEFDQCNPQTHIRDLRSSITEAKKKRTGGALRVKKFDPFAYSHSINISSGYDLSDENKFVNFFDYTPIPFRNDLYVAVNEDVIVRLGNNLFNSQPMNVIPVLIRFRSTTAFDKIINRVSLFAIPEDAFQLLEKVYINAFCEMIDHQLNIEERNRKNADTSMINTHLKLISFMVPRLTRENLNKVMQWVIRVYNSSVYNQILFSENASVIIQRVSSQKDFFCMENIATINMYFNLPLPKKDIANNPRIKYPNTNISYIQFLDGIRDHIEIGKPLLQELLVIAADKSHPARNLAILRFAVYLEYNLIDRSYSKNYSIILWDSIGVGELFNFQGLRSWVPLKYLPETEEIGFQAVFDSYKRKLLGLDFSVYLKPPKSIGGDTELVTLVKELIDLSEWFGNEFEIKKIEWSSEEGNTLLKTIFKAWKKVKEDIQRIKSVEHAFGIKTLQEQYDQLFHFCNICIIPNVKKLVLNSDELRNMYLILSQVEIYIPEILLWSIEKNSDPLFSTLNSINKSEQDSAIKAIIYWVGSKNSNDTLSQEYLGELTHIIQSRRQPGLFRALDLVRYLYSFKHELFSEEMVDKILFGLKRLEQETQFPKNMIGLNEKCMNGIPMVEFSDYRTLISMFIKKLISTKSLNKDQIKNVEEIKEILLQDRYPEVKLPLEYE